MSIEEKCDEFHKEIKVVKDYDFCLNDIYADNEGNRITFESIYMRGAKDMSIIELNNIEDHIDGAKHQASYVKEQLTTLFRLLNDSPFIMPGIKDLNDKIENRLGLLQLHLNAIQKDDDGKSI